MNKPTAPNLLADSGLPLAYAIERADASRLTAPDRQGSETSVRAVVRSLTVMQKEAIVSSSASPISWRLSSDEGPYLAGHDEAPAPLAVTTAGLTADLMEHIHRAFAASPPVPTALSLTVDTFFTMEGSMIKGTMVGGALAPEVTVSVAGVDRAAAFDAVLTGVNAAGTAGLVTTAHTSLFTLTSNGRQIPVGGVGSIDDEAVPEMGPNHSPSVDSQHALEPLVSRLHTVEDKPADAGIALNESQDRALHLRATGRWRPDGIKEIDVDVIRPTGSMFRFLSDEPPGRGEQGRAPDALTLISAGLGFCFMTQIGRFAKIAKQDLGPYRIVQDTRFSIGDATANPPTGGSATAPRTHVFLEPADPDDDYARHALDMSEQTCFLHALCRTELKPKVRIKEASL